MHSDRTYGHELINDEGKRTWNISDGMTYLYNGDQDQYGTGYWATVDQKRLAGTTTEYVTRPDRRETAPGISTAGLAAPAWEITERPECIIKHWETVEAQRNGTDAKKSWFLFDDEIVAVRQITSSTGNYVETVIENRKLKEDGSNQVLIDGEERSIQRRRC